MTKQNLLAKILGLPAGTKFYFDPNDKNFITSLLADNNGNSNMLRFTMDKKAPTIQQRIIYDRNSN